MLESSYAQKFATNSNKFLKNLSGKGKYTINTVNQPLKKLKLTLKTKAAKLTATIINNLEIHNSKNIKHDVKKRVEGGIKNVVFL